MAELTGKTISELPAVASLSDSDMFAVSSGGSSKRTLWSLIRTTIKNETKTEVENEIGLVVDSGSVSLTLPANSKVTQSVTFAKTFASAPAVMLTLLTDTSAVSGGTMVGVTLQNAPTSTGFVINGFNSDTSQRMPVVRWLAVGK